MLRCAAALLQRLQLPRGAPPPPLPRAPASGRTSGRAYALGRQEEAQAARLASDRLASPPSRNPGTRRSGPHPLRDPNMPLCRPQVQGDREQALARAMEKGFIDDYSGWRK